MEKFIAGIFNYCDRWCERCAFTSRCGSFAVEKELKKAAKEGITGRDAFWKVFESIYGKTEMSVEGEDLFEEQGGDVFIPDPVNPEEGNWEKINENFLFKAAHSYSGDTRAWLSRHRGQMINKTESETNSRLTSGVSVNDAVEIVERYSFFIAAKLARAAGEARNEFREPPVDSDVNGSAKVAIIAISRSIAAWSIIRSVYKKDQDKTAELIGCLIAIRRAAEQAFPRAMEFVRPGFDTDGES